uniref:zinc ribbon domain-containing protein n=1 Tax=Eubacterium cellulosolvens TaxID=29322 RepID=UPI000481A25A|nr:zinc ribbon domain-containing protein [[Eubacterium] cellulosolvens]
MKICPKCGKKLDDAVVYCTRCGAALINIDPAAEDLAKDDSVSTLAENAAKSNTEESGDKAASAASNVSAGQNTRAADAQAAPFPQNNQSYNNGYAPYGIPYGRGQLYYNPYDHTADFKPEDISDNKVMAMILYLCGTFGLILALLYKRSAYVTFHVRQILKLLLFKILTGIFAGIIGFFISLFSVGEIINSLSYGTLGAASFVLGSAAFTVPLFITGIVSMVILVIKIICFFHVCNGKAIEAPIVRSIRFMR